MEMRNRNSASNPSGLVYIGGSLAYCPQQAWIQNLTIRENILFGLPYEKAKYWKVVEACGLIPDLKSLAAGDKTEIGPKGLNVSGGQKARISLARACYADADVYVLDAPLAAVDAIVAKDLFSKCILGLLREKTRILITHNPEIITSPFVDSVLRLEGGQFSHVKNMDKKALGPPPVSPLVGTAKTKNARVLDHTSATLGSNDPERGVPPRENHAFSAISPAQLVQDGFAPLVARASSFACHNGLDGKLILDEERQSGRVSSHVFAAYFRAIGGVGTLVYI